MLPIISLITSNPFILTHSRFEDQLVPIMIQILEIVQHIPSEHVDFNSLLEPFLLKSMNLNFTAFVNNVYNKIFATKKCIAFASDEDEQVSFKHRFWIFFMNQLINWAERNLSAKEHLDAVERNNSLESIFKCLYWPLSLELSKSEVSSFT